MHFTFSELSSYFPRRLPVLTFPSIMGENFNSLFCGSSYGVFEKLATLNVTCLTRLNSSMLEYKDMMMLMPFLTEALQSFQMVHEGTQEILF